MKLPYSNYFYFEMRSHGIEQANKFNIGTPVDIFIKSFNSLT